ALRQILRSVGGLQYPPREARLARLLEQLGAGLPRGRTLGGCRILPWRGAVLTCREPRAIRDERPLEPGAALLWDGRFRIELHGAAPALVVRPLQRAGPGELRALERPSGARELPAPVRPGLPSLWRDGALVAVPHLEASSPAVMANARVTVRFAPAWPVAGAPFQAHPQVPRKPLLRHLESLC